jgi:L-ascorbate metabolism protein UlaG (beta-lactamase superfamily)
VRIVKYGHACVRVERDGGVLVIDPGELSEPEALDGADAVLVTHEHFDHVDLRKLADLLEKRPTATIFNHPDVTAKIAQAGTGVEELVREVVPGDEFTAAGFRVRAYGGLHAMIHPELPRVANVGFFVEEAALYHPGDSFDVPTDAAVETLFVPVDGPWLKLAEAAEFVRQVAPRRAFALHDGLQNEIGHNVVTGGMRKLARCEYQRLEPGSTAPIA